MAEAGRWIFTDAAITNLINGTFRLTVDTFKVALFLSTSNISVAATTYAGLTNEHANANGYTTGGATATITLSGTTTVDVKFSVNWTASGGSIIAKWAVLYESGGNVVAYCLLDSTGANVTTVTGKKLTINSSGSPVPAFRAKQAA